MTRCSNSSVGCIITYTWWCIGIKTYHYDKLFHDCRLFGYLFLVDRLKICLIWPWYEFLLLTCLEGGDRREVRRSESCWQLVEDYLMIASNQQNGWNTLWHLFLDQKSSVLEPFFVLFIIFSIFLSVQDPSF